MKIHGLTDSPEHTSWRGARERCLNKNHKDYNLYGGKGIRMCERWNLFLNFLEDMGKRPPNNTLDRIDSDGDYEPSNCRWADKTTQCRNQKIRSDNSSGVKGVCLKGSKWCARISVNKKRIHLGEFSNFNDAKLARLNAENKYWK